MNYQQACRDCLGVARVAERDISRHEERAERAMRDAVVAEHDAEDERNMALNAGRHRCGPEDCNPAAHFKEAADDLALAEEFRARAARHFALADLTRLQVVFAKLRLERGGCILCGDRRYIVGCTAPVRSKHAERLLLRVAA